MAKKNQVITGTSSGAITYDVLIKLCNTLTNITWGFIKPSRKVQCISSKEWPIRIYADRGRKNTAKTVPDIVVNAMNIRDESWEDITGCFLRDKMLELGFDKCKDVGVTTALNTWKPTKNYQIEVEYIKEQQAEHIINESEITIYNSWLDDCMIIV